MDTNLLLLAASVIAGCAVSIYMLASSNSIRKQKRHKTDEESSGNADLKSEFDFSRAAKLSNNLVIIPSNNDKNTVVIFKLQHGRVSCHKAVLAPDHIDSIFNLDAPTYGNDKTASLNSSKGNCRENACF